MIQTIDVSGLKVEQVKQIQAMIEAFKAKNKLEGFPDPSNPRQKSDIIDSLTHDRIKVDSFLSREEIYEGIPFRSARVEKFALIACSSSITGVCLYPDRHYRSDRLSPLSPFATIKPSSLG